jgi:hypothetical protein
VSNLSTETVVFDVSDCKVYPLLTDVTGASPTYGAAVDVPGIAQVSLEPNLTSAELKGDSRIIAKRGRVDRFNFSATYGKLSLDVLNTLLGSSTLNAQGTTPSRTQNLVIASPGSSPYFKLEFLIADVDEGIGSLNVILFKCLLTGGTLFQSSSDSFGQPSLQCEAIATNGGYTPPGGSLVTNPILALQLNETAANLSS